ncbi:MULTISPECIES: hypothetical protein [unclassified Brevundimonas]|uniref:hypothetical protein n=1 Tax=unclassified Brevundimonas TaxID=2622653 RepID=UPI0025BB4893|nr:MULTISPECIES: hypothetical protein [unclassified Brevundimonas]
MLKSIVPAVAALGLVALAGQAMTTSPAAPGESAAGWHLLHEGSMAKLAYGLADSDQVALMLTCSPGDRSAVIYGDAQPQSAALTPASMGPQPIDPLSDGEAYEARLPLTDTALTGLARSGRIAVQTEAGEQQIRASRAERRLVQNFLGYCASSHA